MAKHKTQTQSPAKQIERLEATVKHYIKGVYIEKDPKASWFGSMVASGYAKSYANDQGFIVKRRAKTLIDTERDRLYKEQRFNLQDWESELQDLYKECREDKDKTNAKGVIDSGIKLNGGFIDRSVNLNTEIPSDPVKYKAWLRQELERLAGADKVLDSYAKSEPAIAKRY